MKRYLVLLLTVFVSLMANAQGRGIKIAYIDMDYILDKVTDYAEAKSQLEQKAGRWKQEMDVKRNDITKLKESLQAEKALLTKELIEEREEEIAFQEKELTVYQEQKFGPKGELITQKSVMVKPVQDQVFTIVQDLAEIRKYDFVFDKSSDLTMLFAANKYDISDLVVKRLTRTAKREKLSSKEVKKLEEQEKKEESDSDPDNVDKVKRLEDKKAARQKAIDDRKAAAEAKRAAALEKRDQIRAENAAKRNGTAPKNTPAKTEDKAADAPTDEDDAAAPATTSKAAARTEEAKSEAAAKNADASANRQQAAEEAKAERERKLEERRKAIEARKQQVLEQREAAKKAREEKLKAKNGTSTDPAAAPQTTTPSPTSNTEGED
jgi:Skp family chaperone for outer membrane proteins